VAPSLVEGSGLVKRLLLLWGARQLHAAAIQSHRTGGWAIGDRLATRDNGELRFAAYARRKRRRPRSSCLEPQ